MQAKYSIFKTFYIPSATFEASAGILEAKANKRRKYTAHMTLSAATPAVITEGETWSASHIAM